MLNDSAPCAITNRLSLKNTKEDRKMRKKTTINWLLKMNLYYFTGV